MGEHDPLGLPGGARSIDEGSQILRLDCETAQPTLHVHGGCGSICILEQRGERRAFRAGDIVHDDDALELRPAADGGNLVVLCLGRYHGDASTGIDQQFGDLFSCERGIDGHIRRAQHQGSEVHHRPFPAIFGQQGDAVTLDDAPGCEGLSGGIHAG